MAQHVNFFNKGLNSDYQIVYQPDGTYRYLKNCELISQDGNNYAIKDCLGNTVMFTINAPYSAVIHSIKLNLHHSLSFHFLIS